MAITDDTKTDPRETALPALRIEYCASCGFLARATGLAENVLHDFHRQLPGGVTVVAGEEGSFEVFLDGTRIFSMLDLARFPEPNEVENRLETMLKA